MKAITVLVFAILSGCSTTKVWLVQWEQNAGIIGYSKGDEVEAEKILDEKFVRTANEICSGRRWHIVRDRLNSSTHSSTVVYPVATFGGESSGYAQTGTSFVPVNHQQTMYWREAEVVCESGDT